MADQDSAATGAGDEVTEQQIDALRLKAFATNDEADRRRYFEAASKWFQDRHYRDAALRQENERRLQAILDEQIKHGETLRDLAALRQRETELLAALKAVVRIADRKTLEFDAAREAIAKAEGRHD